MTNYTKFAVKLEVYQPAAAGLGYTAGDFPMCERDCASILTLPAHPYLTHDEVSYAIEQVRAFCVSAVPR